MFYLFIGRVRFWPGASEFHTAPAQYRASAILGGVVKTIVITFDELEGGSNE